MNELPRQKLCEMIARHGWAVCEEPGRCEGLLRDYCPGHRAEVNVLVIAIKERVAADLLNSSTGIPVELLLSRLSRRLEDEHGLKPETSRWAVESWALALGKLSPEDLTQHPKEAPSAGLAVPGPGTEAPVKRGGSGGTPESEALPPVEVTANVPTRSNAWWSEPILVFLGFSVFIAYLGFVTFITNSNWAESGVTQMSYWRYWDYLYDVNGANYLSPFIYWLPLSPAYLMMWIPATFRFNFAVGAPCKTHFGKLYLPFIIQKIHGYFLCLALFFFGRDAWNGMWFADLTQTKHFGFGVGTLVLVVNFVLLAGYTFRCRGPRLNRRHMLWAGLSCFWVCFTAVYIGHLCRGTWHDYRLITF